MLQDPEESVELLERHPNLVLLRTFSKVYGLCGLRVGYGLCGSESFRTAVDQVRQPFFCNAAAQAAALEALEPPATRSPAASSATSPSAWGWRTACAGWASSPPTRRPTSSGSTSPTRTPSPRRVVVRGLAERGVLVRSGSALGREGALRVTVGTEEENERFVEALGSLIG